MDNIEVYKAVPLNDSVYRITEKDVYDENPFMYLVKGKEFFVLIDTGCNSGNLLAFIKDLALGSGWVTDKILVINTHNHYDHVASNYRFSPPEGKVQSCVDLCASAADRKYTEDRFNHVGWSCGCHVQEYTVTRWLQDNEKIVLDNDDDTNYLQVLYTPGHTPDSICLYYPAESMIFMGDFIYRYCPILAITVKSSLQDFQTSCQRLVQFIDREEEKNKVQLTLACGHIDDKLASDYCNRLDNLLHRILKGELRPMSGGWMVQYTNGDDLMITTRRCIACDFIVKPLAKLYVSICRL